MKDLQEKIGRAKMLTQWEEAEEERNERGKWDGAVVNMAMKLWAQHKAAILLKWQTDYV